MRSGQRRIFGNDGPWRAAAATLVALLALGVTGCERHPANPAAQVQTPAVPVTVAPVRQADIPVQLQAIGTVQAHVTVSLKSQLSGEIVQVGFTEGQMVKRGDLLFVIDPRPLEAELERAQADLARDQAQLKNAREEVQRLSELLAQKVSTQREYDRALFIARALEATATADEAAIRSAKLQLEYTRIVAPMDGRMGQVLIDRGNVVKANDVTLAVLTQISPIDVAFAVPQQHLPQIRQHQTQDPMPVEVSAPPTNQVLAQGRLSFIDSAVDPTTGTVLLKAEFANTDQRLWPGQFVNASLTLTTQRGALLVPLQAVQTGQRGSYVFLVQPDQTVAMQPVTVDRLLQREAVITDGLAPGQTVVTDGQLGLSPGKKVQLAEAPAPTTQAASRSEP